MEICDEQYYEFKEQYTLLLKSARRCMYDLKHCANSLSMHRDKESELFLNRARMWEDIFSPDGIKRYKHELHDRIFSLECEIKRLETLCKNNGINPVDPNSIPF